MDYKGSRYTYPRIGGHEYAGVIEKLGKDVDNGIFHLSLIHICKKGRNTDDELRNCYRIYERDTGAYYILISKIKSECSTHLLDSLQ